MCTAGGEFIGSVGPLLFSVSVGYYRGLVCSGNLYLLYAYAFGKRRGSQASPLLLDTYSLFRLGVGNPALLRRIALSVSIRSWGQEPRGGGTVIGPERCLREFTWIGHVVWRAY